MTDKMSFQQALARFRKVNVEAMELAVYCSRLAIGHYYDHGDTAYMQQLWDAMAKNWNRRVALGGWFQAYADVEFDTESSVWKKDKAADAIVVTDEMKKEALTGKTFFDFVPEAVYVPFNAEALDKAFVRVLKQFSLDPENKRKPADTATIVHLNEIRNALAKVVKGVSVVPVAAETEEEPEAEEAPADEPLNISGAEPEPMEIAAAPAN